MSEEEKDSVVITDLENADTKKLVFSKTFTVDTTDEAGKRLVGQFTVKRATLGDLQQFGVIKARLCGGERGIDRGIEWMNEMIAFCQVSLTEFPQWWEPADMYDQDLLVKIYQHVRQFQDSFRDRRMAGQRSAPSVDSSVQP